LSGADHEQNREAPPLAHRVRFEPVVTHEILGFVNVLPLYTPAHEIAFLAVGLQYVSSHSLNNVLEVIYLSLQCQWAYVPSSILFVLPEALEELP
jgi:hypothetical protein